jgi:hydroxymethylbilane synthase
LRGLVGYPDGSKVIRGEIGGKQEDAQLLGKTLAEELLTKGAGAILQTVYSEQQPAPP